MSTVVNALVVNALVVNALVVNALVVNALDPFSPTSDELNKPNIILRSSDNVYFFTHKQMLAFSSHFFSNMFSFPQPTGADANPTYNDLDVVAVPETSAGLRVLLLTCYPRFCTSYHFETLDGVAVAYEAAKKYDIAGSIAHLEGVLRDPRFREQQPHRVFAIACLCGLEDIAKLAALETLKQPLPHPGDLIPEYRILPAYYTWILDRFRHQCADRIDTVLRDYIAERTLDDIAVSDNQFWHRFKPAILHLVLVWWFPMAKTELKHAEDCGPVRVSPDDFPETLLEPAAWFVRHVVQVRQAFALATNYEKVARSLDEIFPDAMAEISKCPRCMARAAQDLRELGDNFRDLAEVAISEELNAMTFTGS
ncbi:hypothetical protein C8F01DRAFT_1368399 [Mycena amicta]|nr:hypothetical protein C8F01DRAFT_1368399 [Mycena amicta]